MKKTTAISITRDFDYLCAPAAAAFRRWIRLTQHAQATQESICFNIHLASEATSQQLNARYRQKNYATNVLSFRQPLGTQTTTVLADLVFCPTIIEQQAAAAKRFLSWHWAHLCIHGCLHILGFDHQEDAAALAMQQQEITLLQKLAISNPYT